MTALVGANGDPAMIVIGLAKGRHIQYPPVGTHAKPKVTDNACTVDTILQLLTDHFKDKYPDVIDCAAKLAAWTRAPDTTLDICETFNFLAGFLIPGRSFPSLWEFRSSKGSWRGATGCSTKRLRHTMAVT